jgi:hypothetical protein
MPDSYLECDSLVRDKQPEICCSVRAMLAFSALRFEASGTLRCCDRCSAAVEAEEAGDPMKGGAPLLYDGNRHVGKGLERNMHTAHTSNEGLFCLGGRMRFLEAENSLVLPIENSKGTRRCQVESGARQARDDKIIRIEN